MPDFTQIVLLRSIPLSRRLREVKKRINQWSRSLDKPYNEKTDALRLVRVERNKDEFVYSYAIERGVNRGREMS